MSSSLQCLRSNKRKEHNPETTSPGLEISTHLLVFMSRCSLKANEKIGCLPDRMSNFFLSEGELFLGKKMNQLA